MIVRSFDGLQSLTTPAPSWSNSSSSALNLYGLNQAYAEIYRTQPNVRICVDFLAKNIAHVGLQVFRRVSNTDRVRLVDHELARWIGKPNPATGRYRLIESLVSDLGIYFNAYLLKVRHLDGAGRPALGFVRLPPDQMEVKGGLLATHYTWTANGRVKDFALSEIVYFNGYNPSNPLMGLSPLETLRRILAEEAAAGENREAYWRNASRMEGVIEQAKDGPAYSPTQHNSFREQWQEYSAGGSKVGMVGILPKGMSIKPWSFSAKDSEYTIAGKLRREICAAEYGIPQPFVGILEHATFSNIKEQHKHLYQDTLGPWFEMLIQEWERQALIECEDQTDVYLEFNIDAKMAGSFEEQAQSLQLAVGKPFMKVNEARALRNLPRDDDPESDRIAPQQGGPSDATAHPNHTRPARPPADPDEDDDEDDVDALIVAPVVQALQGRLQARLEKLPAAERVAAFDLDRWRRELVTNLTPLVGADRAVTVAARVISAEHTRLAGEAA